MEVDHPIRLGHMDSDEEGGVTPLLQKALMKSLTTGVYHPVPASSIISTCLTFF